MLAMTTKFLLRSVLPVVPGSGNLFFQLVAARYERGAMILTSYRGFAEWGDVFDPVVATALLDRLLRHAVVIQSRAPATGYASTPNSCPSTFAPKQLSLRRHRRGSRVGAVDHRKWLCERYALTGGSGDFYFGGFEDF